MDEYNKLLDMVNEYLSSEDIASNEDIISIKDLRDAIDYKFSYLRNAIDNLELARVSNNKIFNKLCIAGVEDLGIDNGMPYCIFRIKSGNKNIQYVNVVRDNGYILNENVSDEIVKLFNKGIGHLYSIFGSIEDCRDLLVLDYHFKNILLNSGMFQCLLDVDNKFGNVSTDLKLSPSLDYNHIGDRMWLSKRPLNEIIKENSEELLSKIPIEVDNLHKVYQDTIYEYLEDIKYEKDFSLVLD